jgi:hypothetical protein
MHKRGHGARCTVLSKDLFGLVAMATDANRRATHILRHTAWKKPLLAAWW